MHIIKLLFLNIRLLPEFLSYIVYDLCTYFYYRKNRIFYGWGIHLFTGKFGQGKTSLMTIKAYDLCEKYPQLHVLTNYKLTNFPEHTKILPLRTPQDILNAPVNTICLIDEIGTIFNSRDFSSGKRSVPKPVYQHLCQCRKRHMMIFASVQRYNLVDKQIRDVSATVTECRASFRHPFTRKLTGFAYDIEEYEAFANNRMYQPVPYDTYCFIQSEKYRHLYDTTELIENMLDSDYISDEEILRNRGEISENSDYSKEGIKNYKKAMRRRR